MNHTSVVQKKFSWCNFRFAVRKVEGKTAVWLLLVNPEIGRLAGEKLILELDLCQVQLENVQSVLAIIRSLIGSANPQKLSAINPFWAR